MDKKSALEALQQFRQENGSHYGILSLGLFGSTARDTATESSDVDVVISLKKPNLLTLSKIRVELEDRLHRHVDIVSYRERMNPFLKERIQRDVSYV